MRRILITGQNSYIGVNLKRWLEEYRDKYSVVLMSIRNDLWKEENFYGYDVVVHVAGIAHIKQTSNNAKLYDKVNCDLAYEVARKSKKDKVEQFIFLSSMSVYGLDSGIIDENTQPNPKDNYGKSKLRAEEQLKSLEEESFRIAILRPPMVYGNECTGNYTKLAKFAMKTAIFPLIINSRSMIYVENLCEFIRLLIDDNTSKGLYFPQNNDYVCTSDMVRLIARVHGKRIIMTKLFNPIIRVFKLQIFNKIFGSLFYEKGLSEYKEEYCLFNFEESIKKTESGSLN